MDLREREASKECLKYGDWVEFQPREGGVVNPTEIQLDHDLRCNGTSHQRISKLEAQR
jgi:hypothetical protein